MQPLLPVHHPNHDFFVCNVLDAVPKDDMASMEHPVFSLSTKPDTRVLFYECRAGTIKISPTADGLATIHDKDILIYCISQLIAKMNRGESPSRKVRLKAYDLLVATNRQTNGRSYARLKAAFERLAGTRITTDITTNSERIISGFGLLDAWKIVIKDPKTERMVELEATLSEWLYNAVLGKEVLTLHRDYFRLRKPLERRIYEIARKHCGQQKEWSISLVSLRKKCGSTSRLKEFRRMLKALVTHNHLPDYHVRFNADKDTVTVLSRPDRVESYWHEDHDFPFLKPETYEKARRAAPGYDVYDLEQDWHLFWLDRGKPELDSPDAAFVGFCKHKHKTHPLR